MPYKHIATHLKKTELACRLHYHQLSHGSNRRKRTTSVSSGSSSHSPVMHANAPSPIYESTSAPGTPDSYAYSMEGQNVHLPPAASLLSRSGSSSPQRTLSQPIAILPKPSPSRQATTTPPLRLDCAVPISGSSSLIDYKRLAHIYELHRAPFWATIAAEYGQGASPYMLEEAWRHGNGNAGGIAYNTIAPPTPCISPEGGNVYHREEKSAEVENRASATSISALLGIDASPRSPQERELIKRIEEGRMEAA